MIRKGKWSDSLIDITSGVNGILTNIEPARIPDGFVPEMTNMHAENGIIHSIKGIKNIGSLSNPIKMMFMWHQDNGSNTLFAQAGNVLYKYDGTTWSAVYSFSNDFPCSISGGFFDHLYIMQKTDGFFKYDGTNMTHLTSAPNAEYLLLWQTYLFAGGSLKESDGTYAPFRVRWSPFTDLSLTDWYSDDAVNNFVDFRTPGNSNILGIGVWNRRIIVFTKDSIEELAGSEPSNFVVNTIYKGKLTAINNRSVAYYDYVYYLSPDGLCVMAKDAITIGDIYKKYWHDATFYSLTQNKGILYGNSDHDILVYKTLSKTFEHYLFPATVLYADDEKIYVGDESGNVGVLFEDDAFLEWEMKTREINYRYPVLYKRAIGLDIMYEKSAVSSTVDVYAKYDDNDLVLIGQFDPSSGEFTHINVRGLFKKAQIIIKGSGEFHLKSIEFTSKVKRKGGR